MENTTRIVDLPENISIQMPSTMTPGPNGNSRRSNFEEPTTTYSPMNIHPNPYGNSVQPLQMDLPEFQGSNRGGEDMSEYVPKEHRRLPSRDIPMDQTIYHQDEEIQPNYIPKPKLTGDYIKEYGYASEKKIQKHEKDKRSMEEIDAAMTDFQIPIFVALLFLIFNMPILNILLFKYFKMLPIFHTDGNLNFYGSLMKSILFGIVFWIIQRVIKFLLVF